MTVSTFRQVSPTTPARQRRRPMTPHWFGLFPFRSPLLRESLLFSIPRGTEMFQFPRFPLPALYIQAGMTGHDPSLVSQFGHPRINAYSSTPRGFFADHHVLHRLLAPRHPPTTRSSLNYIEYFDFVLAMQFSKSVGTDRVRSLGVPPELHGNESPRFHEVPFGTPPKDRLPRRAAGFLHD